ncbi:MAG: hypothetical protein ABR548_01500 [Actinomycetota bacterium]
MDKYLGIFEINGVPSHLWSDGQHIRVVSGGEDVPDSAVTDDDDDDATEVIRDRKGWAHSHREAKYRTRAKTERARAETAEQATLTLQIENAFLRAVAGRVTDLDAAYRLADLSDVELDETGELVGVQEAVEATLARYPLLLGGEESPTVPLEKSGRPINRNKNRAPTPDRTALETRYPALRSRRPPY